MKMDLMAPKASFKVVVTLEKKPEILDKIPDWLVGGALEPVDSSES